MTERQIATIARGLAVIPFYPREEHDVILLQLAAFVEQPEQLQWLVDAAIANMPEWRGVAALRALYAERPRLEKHPDSECSKCGGCGYETIYRGNYSFAQRCSCWAVGNPAPLESGGGEGPRAVTAGTLQPVAALIPASRKRAQ